DMHSFVFNAASPTAIYPLSLHDALPICKRRHSGVIRQGGCDAESLFQVIADAECIGHDGQRGVNSGAGREEAAIHNIKIVDLVRSEEHTSELQSRFDLVCRLLLEKKKRL